MNYLRFLGALIFVLALLGIIAWLVKRYGLAGVVAVAPRNRLRRLTLVEALAIDARRRLVLVRRDGVEHLLLLGMGNDLLVESDIAPQALPPLIDDGALEHSAQ